MPTQTFFNLQGDKQQKIIEVSKNEFTKCSFYEASINRIVKEARIARGSFYQYFENKEDLFIYILDEYINKIKKILIENVKDRKYNIFELIILIYDFVTVEGVNDGDKEFIITVVSNMDIKLAYHLLEFSKPEEINKNLSDFNEIVNMDNLAIHTQQEMLYLHNILINIMMGQIVMFFSHRDDERKCREDLINKFNLIKYGVLKK